MGPVPNERLLEEICNGLKTKKPMKKFNLEFFLTIDIIRFTEGRLEPGEPRARAVHVWVPQQQAERARDIFKRLCPSKPRADYVMGIKWTFMTHPASSLTPVWSGVPQGL